MVIELNFRSDFQHKVWSGVLKLRFGQYFAAGCLVEVAKLNLGQDYEARFGHDFEF